jgi:capsular polysaccharide biosynthesis protein
LNTDEFAVVHDKNNAVAERYRFMMNAVSPGTADAVPFEPFIALPEGKFVLWKQIYGGDTRYSAWSDVDGTVVGSRYYYVRPHEGSFEHDITVETAEKVTLQGDHFAMALEFNFAAHYGHFKHDVLPILAYYKSVLPANTKFILPYTAVMRDTLELIDPVFVREQVYWLQMNVIVSVVGGTLTVNHPQKTLFNKFHDLWNPLRAWMQEKMPPAVSKERTVIYYKRTRTSSFKGRVFDEEQEQELLRRIQKAMSKYKRPEKLVIFSGNNPDGTKMTSKEQLDLFRSAATIIGPHGTGLGGNLLWADPAPKDCASRVHVLEFITSDETSAEVQQAWISHYRVYRGLPLDFHVLFYDTKSTNAATYIDLDMADEFLDTIWGSGD